MPSAAACGSTSTGAASATPPLCVKRWRAMVVKVFFVFASTLMEDVAQRRSGKKKGLQRPTPAQERCPHPAKSRQTGANQYAKWSKCAVCSLRLAYEPTAEVQKKQVARVKAQEEEIAASVPAAAGGQASEMRHTQESSTLLGERLLAVLATQIKALAEVQKLMETMREPESSPASQDAEYVWGESTDWSLPERPEQS